MPTILQRNLAKNIILNTKRKKPLNKQELVVLSGYNSVTADRHSKEVIEQKGVIESLAEEGFTEDTAKRVIKSILTNEKNDPGVRIRAAEQVFKVLGSYAPDKSINLTSTVSITDDEFKQVLELYGNNNGKPSNGEPKALSPEKDI